MGILYIVGTPIGNLEDITYRALRTLRETTVIAAEDTRHTRKLLSHFDIHTPLVSYHEHNWRTAGPALVARLTGGNSVALVTDAGMPAISDPGGELVHMAILAGIQVVAVPGPTAFVTALVVSGLPTGRFVFEGFLSTKKKERREALERLRSETRTMIFYEAPHRLVGTLGDIQQSFGDRGVAVARELTKIHEEVLRGTPGELVAHFSEHQPRGEFVVVVRGNSEQETRAPVMPEPAGMVTAVRELENQGVPRKPAMKEVAERLGVSRRDVYQALLAEKEEHE